MQLFRDRDPRLSIHLSPCEKHRDTRPARQQSDDNYKIAIDKSQSLEKRFAAFHTRPLWLRNLSFQAPKIEQLKAMVEHFGELGLIERREHDAGPEFPAVMYVETLAQKAGPVAALGVSNQPAPKGPSASQEFVYARFPRLRP